MVGKIYQKVFVVPGPLFSISAQYMHDGSKSDIFSLEFFRWIKLYAICAAFILFQAFI